MDLFRSIALDITLPLTVLIAFGYLLQRGTGISAKPLGQLLNYAVLPAAIFHFLTSANLPLSAVAAIALFVAVQFVLFVALGWATATLFGIAQEIRPFLALAVAFPNAGNFGIPLVEFAFGRELILHQSIITSVYLVLVILSVPLLTSGGLNAGKLGQLLIVFLKSPLILAVAAALTMKSFDLLPPSFLASSLEIMAGGLTPLALLTLGVQIAVVKWRASLKPLVVGLVLCLVVTPVLTWLAATGLGFDDRTVELLTVGAVMPVALTLAIFAAEQNKDGGFASTIAVVTTIVSPITVTAAFFILRS